MFLTKYKKGWRLIFAFTFISAFIFPAAAARPAWAEYTARVTVDGAELPEGAYFSGDRVMAPVGALARAMGAETEWTPATQDVFVYLYGRYAWLQVTNPTLYYGGYMLDGAGEILLANVETAPFTARPAIQKDRAYAPLKNLIDVLGGQIIWDSAARTAHITSPAPGPEPLYESGSGTAPAGEGEADSLPAAGYFRWLTVPETLEKYTTDDPFVLLCCNSAQHAAAFRETVQAAADLKLTLYGLDAARNETTALPFATESGGVTPCLYFVNGRQYVKSLYDLTYESVKTALIDYWRA